MYKRLLLSLLAASSFTAIYAEYIPPDAALSRALSSETSLPARARANNGVMTLSHTFNTISGTPAVYLFRNADNALLLPADDMAHPVLAYFDGNAKGEMPPQLQWWIDQYARQIAYAREHSSSTPIPLASAQSAQAKANAEKAPIAPLLTTTWDQGEPYNNQCPMDGSQRSYTGCVATAMAQVMKYWNYPESGTGSISYTDQFSNTTRTLDFTGKKFDWGNMLNSYDGSYTTTQANAVAWLMKACGFATQMNYSAQASSSYTAYVVTGAKEYFKYNTKGTMLSRNLIGRVEWENLVYENLSKVGPVLYGGDDRTSGHAFVCDGYSSDGFFHFNWGWSGMFDGYFQLDALTPIGQGAGGNSGGFNFGQEIIVNFCPPDHATISTPEFCPITLLGSLAVESFNGKNITFTSTLATDHRVAVYNAESYEVSARLGIKIIDKADNSVSYQSNYETQDWPTNAGIDQIPERLILAAGNYRVSLVASIDNGSWEDLACDLSYTDYIDITVNSAGNITEAKAPEVESIEITDLKLDSKLCWNTPFRVSFSAKNKKDSETIDGLQPVIFTITSSGAASIKAYGTNYYVDLLGNESISRTIDTPMTTAVNSFTGKAYLGLVSLNTNAIIEYISVNVEKTPGTPELSATKFSFVGNPKQANALDLQFDCGVQCTSGYYTSPICVYISTSGSQTYAAQFFSDQTYYLSSGEKASSIVKGSLPNAYIGETYIATLGYISGQYVMPLHKFEFTIASKNSGIEGVADEAEAQPVAVELYTVDGRQISKADAEGRGIVIVRSIYTDGSSTVKKEVR